jgi:hypothetical protein
LARNKPAASGKSRNNEILVKAKSTARRHTHLITVSTNQPNPGSHQTRCVRQISKQGDRGEGKSAGAKKMRAGDGGQRGARGGGGTSLLPAITEIARMSLGFGKAFFLDGRR